MKKKPASFNFRHSHYKQYLNNAHIMAILARFTNAQTTIYLTTRLRARIFYEQIVNEAHIAHRKRGRVV